jgi:hypothetical protein
LSIVMLGIGYKRLNFGPLFGQIAEV